MWKLSLSLETREFSRGNSLSLSLSLERERDVFSFLKGFPSFGILSQFGCTFFSTLNFLPSTQVTTRGIAEARNKEKQGAMMGSVFEVAWRISVLDIEATLREATSKLFRDEGSVSTHLWNDRARSTRGIRWIYKGVMTGVWPERYDRVLGGKARRVDESRCNSPSFEQATLETYTTPELPSLDIHEKQR